jgi:YggT family protein
MPHTAIAYLLEVLASLFGGACLLRAYTNYHGIALQGPVGRVVAGLTDWAVLPLRRMLPRPGRWDLASLLLAVVAKAIQFGVQVFWLGGGLWIWLELTAVGLVQLVCTLITVLMIVFVLASWVRVDPAVHDWLRRVCAPLLAPLQRVLPPLGNVDLSPLVVTLAAQMFSRSLDHWQDQWLQRVLLG